MYIYICVCGEVGGREMCLLFTSPPILVPFRYIGNLVGAVCGSFVAVTFGNVDSQFSTRTAALSAVPSLVMVVPGSIAYRG